MNKELHTLFWYTRSELVLIRRRNKSFISDQSPGTNFKTVSGEGLRDEVDIIIRGMIETIDETMAAEAKLWNTPFIIHVLQALSVHMRNLKMIEKTSCSHVYTLLPLDIDYTRVRCYIDLLVAVCQANVVRLCALPDKVVPDKVDARIRKSKLSESVESRKQMETSGIPCLFRSRSGKKITMDNTSDFTRCSSSNSYTKKRMPLTPPVMRKSLSYCSKSRSTPDLLVQEQKQTKDKMESSKTPSHEVLRWRAAHEAIRWIVRTPQLK